MGLTNVQKLLKEQLLKLGWLETIHEGLIAKNDCFLHLTNDPLSYEPLKSYTYSDDEIQAIISSDYNKLDFKKVTPLKNLLVNVKGVHFYLEKYGWLLLKGKYSSTYNGLFEDNLSSDNKAANEFRELITRINEISERDYVELRGVKQGNKIIYNNEIAYKPVPSSREFGIGSIIQIQSSSYRSNLFKEKALLKIDLILDNEIIVTALNEKGVVTNRQYKISLDIIKEEIIENNIATVELEQYTEQVPCEVWIPFNDIDNAAKLPTELYKYIKDDTQREALMECFKYCLNFSPILNPGITSESYPRVIEMLHSGFITEKLLTEKLRESSTLLLSSYVHRGLNPEQFIDGNLNSFTLEEALQERIAYAEEIKNRLSSQDLNEDLVEFVYNYCFQYGKDIPCNIDTNMRWHFLVPYYLENWFSQDELSQFINLIKMYATLGPKACYLKVSFLSAELKGAILKYFKCPQDIMYKEKSWTDFILDLLNGDYQLVFSKSGLAIRGSVYSVCRDMNSVYICDLANKPVWRCVFINEEKFINCIDSNIYF